MTESFTLGGDPGSIRTSAGRWSRFATSTSSASSELTGVRTEEFVGAEGDTYRARIADDLVPHLDAASEAWGIVAAALTGYANGLEELQSRMATLRTRYTEQQSTVDHARTNLQHAKAADRQHTLNRMRAVADLSDGLRLPPDTYRAQAGEAHTEYTEAKSELDGLQRQAAAIRAEHRTLVDTCCRQIDNAKQMRPVDPPNLLQRAWNGVCDGIAGAKKWIAENAAVLKVVSEVLKTVSMVAGVLALIPCLAPIMGPIALITGAAGLIIDAAVMWATDSWDPMQLGIDALGLVPGVKAVTTIGKGAKLAKAGAAMGKAGNKVGDAKGALKVVSKARRAPIGSTRAARATVRRAEIANRSAINAFTKLTGKYQRIDTAFKIADPIATVGSSGLTVAKTRRDGGSWGQAIWAGGLSLAGTKIPGASKKANAIQSIVSSGLGTGDQIAQLATNPEKRKDWKEWRKLAVNAGKAWVHTSNGAAYGSAGTHPNGTRRQAYENPDYVGKSPRTTDLTS